MTIDLTPRRLRRRVRGAAVVFLLGVLGCESSSPEGQPARAESAAAEAEDAAWVELFNGRDLTGWVPKIRGEAAGVDSRRTFRVEGGLLVVSYDEYDPATGFDDTFGHLFFESPFEAYELVVEYRFVDEQFAGGPGWARANSGVMFHAQAPETMGVDQDFPVSLEVQFLGGAPGEVRPTANLCTPGTHVDIEGVRVTEHCVTADAPTLPDSVWVSTTLVVRPDGSVHHLVGSDTVIAYTAPVVGGGEANGTTSEAPAEGTALRGGYIALQSESHPIQFRRVAIRPAGDG